MSRFWRRLAILVIAGLGSASAAASDHDYRLQPLAVGAGVYALVGSTDNFSRDNGGNIVNTGFIIGRDGVIVIDTGPSRAYGEQQRAAIRRLTRLPVKQVLLTHAHPDHVFGNQAYADVPIAALPATGATLRRDGDALLGNLYRLVGDAMRGTEVVVPTADATPGTLRIAGRSLRLIAERGHTDGDLMILDEASGVLFTGDLVFHRRAATTPNADLDAWFATLAAIDRLAFKVMVPGHGPVLRDHAAVAETRGYLQWLTGALRTAAAEGRDMAEVLRLPIPARFRSLAVVGTEYERSVSHLYPDYELDVLAPPAPAANGDARR